MAENNAKWLDASYYQNMPNSEVNWAQLAQKWMQMRDAGEVTPVTSDDSIPPPPNNELLPSHPPPAPDGLPVNGSFLPPSGYLPTMPVDANFATPSPCWIPPPPPNNFGPPAGGAFPPFMPPVPPWMGVTPVPPGPFPPAPPYGDAKLNVDEEEGGEYSHYYKEWDEKQKSSRRDNDSDDSETVPEGAMAHWLKPGPGWTPPPNWYHPSRRDSPSNSHSMPFIDQQTRKALPAWIREGLEKAEQERQKKQTKEAKLRAAEEAAKARRASKGLGKFDSDSSEDENGTEDAKERVKLDGEPVFLQKKKLEKQHEQPAKDITEIDYRTEEETREDALMLLRRFMTEILLETTDDELSRIAREQIEFAKRSAQPKVLAQSSALAALCTLGAESDDESNEETDMKQLDESTNKTKGEEFSKKSSITGDGNGGGNEDDTLFSVPLLPVLSSGAKSKAKLSSNDGFSSTESSQGVEKKKAAVQEKKNGDDGPSRVALPKSGNDACKEIGQKKFDSNSDGSNKKDRKEKHARESKKQYQRKKSGSKECPKKRRRGSSKEDLTKKDADHTLNAKQDNKFRSDSDKSGSRTPEHYRRRSSSTESYHKRRRSRSHKRLRSNSRSRTKRNRRFEERHNSRSRSRERRRSGERHHRDRYFRRSRS
ncbi:unnamed protein product [Cercopithifilaria johnstoni]|uniref:Uncharacterized protein n=1 Tax=Cercopithifilaria johnstoni TaxID=2874296 RepID=A0A8J2PWZ8_9BILA|nr:unnamed protein product [Cercopithifilaria johnstoni]